MPFTRPLHALRRTRQAAAFVPLSLLLLTALISLVHPARAETTSLEEVIREIERQITVLRNDPNAPEEWLELQEINKNFDRINDRHASETDPLRERLHELRQTEAVQEHQRQIEELQVTLEDAYERLHETLNEEGRRQLQERIAQLEQHTASETPQALALGLDVLSYPRVEGSTSTNPLAVIIACKATGTPYVWRDRTERRQGRFAPMRVLNWGAASDFGSRTALALRLAGYRPEAVPAHDGTSAQRSALLINRELTNHSGTHEAYVSIIQGESDIALIARAPSDEERALAEKHGVYLEQTPVARDAFVFINHVNNPVSSLTLDQIRAIYRGDIGNWNEVGGTDAKITPYQREEQSGSQELMKELVMPDLNRPKEHSASDNGEDRMTPRARQLLVAESMSGPYFALTHDENGLAYSVYYYAYYMIGSPRTKLVAIDGVMPAYDTIRDKSYPLTADVYVVARKDLAEDSPAGRWREWLLSPEGQSVVRESGYVPVLETLD